MIPSPPSSDDTAAPEVQRAFRLLLYDALASEAMSTMATGVFLTGFAVALGASNLAIGVLAAVPSAVQFLQIPAVILVEQLRRRRFICSWAAGVGRTFLIIAAAAPLVGGTASVFYHVDCFHRSLAGFRGCGGLRLELLDAGPCSRGRLTAGFSVAAQQQTRQWRSHSHYCVGW